MHLRTATPEDLALLQRWDRQPDVIEFAGDPDENHRDWEHQLGRAVPWRGLLIAPAGGVSMGFIQIFDPAEKETHYQRECGPGQRAIDIWIGEARNIRRGYGRRVMGLATERCLAAPVVSAMLIDPLCGNHSAHRFYDAKGFSFIEQRRFGADTCFVYRLNRAEGREET